MHSCRQVIAAQPAPKEHLWIKKSKLRDRITFSNTSAYSGRKKKKRLNKKPSYLETMKEVKKIFFFLTDLILSESYQAFDSFLQTCI